MAQPKLQVRKTSLDPSDQIKYVCPFDCGFVTSLAKDKDKKAELDKHVKACKLNPYLKEAAIKKVEEEQQKLQDKIAKLDEKKEKFEVEKKDLSDGKQSALRKAGVKKVEYFADKAMVLPLILWSNPSDETNSGATLNAWTYMEEQGYEIMQIMPLMSGPPIMFFRRVEKDD
jgi:hypothetical protein